MNSHVMRRGLVVALVTVAVAFSFSFSPELWAQQAEQPNLVAQGEWSATKTYAVDDLVTARGSTWRALKTSKNKLPGQTSPSTAAWWQLFARGFNPTGAWSSATKYQPDDLVTSGGQTYRAKLTNLHRPTTNTTFWELLAAKGAPGPNTGVSGGSQSAPAISFSGDSDTGIYSPGTGKIALVEDGTVVLHNKGTANTALGASALAVNTVGTFNTALGDHALANATGGSNTAVGRAALWGNGASPNSGDENTAVGMSAIQANTTGIQNTAVGKDTLLVNSTGSSNTAVGWSALSSNTSGTRHTAVGYSSLVSMSGGTSNVAIGYAALSGTSNGSHTIAIGDAAAANVDTLVNNSIFIGNAGASGDSNLIKIGTQGLQTKTFVAGIRGITTGTNDAIAVLIDSNGQLGTVSSSRRYKDDIKPLGDMTAMLQRLRPVTFRYKQPQSDGSKPIQYGLIAEEVAEVFPDLAVFNKNGTPETVKYHALPSFLLAGYQTQQQTIAAQAQKIDAQAEQIAMLKERISATEALEARLARLEAALPPTRAASIRQ